MNIDINNVKIIVTIPVDNVEDVRKVICEAGAGIIGNYTYCSITTKCIGTFKPTENANPYIGKKNKLELLHNYLPYVFTEQGIDMLAGILKSEVAIQVSIKIMDSFVEMRKFISVNKSLFEKAVTFYFAKILLILGVLCYTNFNS